jgi:Domain of unknown function (DUF5667)
MSDYADRELVAPDQLMQLLTAYADARLTPASPVLARMRAALVAQAHAGSAQAAEQRRFDHDRATGRRWALPSFHAPRRAAAFALAATLTLGTTAAVFAARPGSPFYGARVAIENALLPNNANARLASHEDHLAQRLAEAQEAAARGDSVGLAAALEAYRDEVGAAVADLGDDAARLAHLEEELGRHVAVLQALEATLPSEASIERAIDVSQKAVDGLRAKEGHPAGKPPPAPHATRPPTTNPDQEQGDSKP